MLRRFIAGLVFAYTLAVASVGFAYSTPEAFSESPATGGGGGRWFSGSPADGFGCDVCHVQASGQAKFPLYAAGLAMDGFSPADAREIVLSWPEWAARWTQLKPVGQAVSPDTPLPSMGLVTELVAESGKASGTIEIDTKTASAAEQCEMSRPNLAPRLAARLYQVRAGVEPLMVRPDANGVLRCEARQLGQRCLMAVSSCGASQLRFKWTAPPQSEGAIWFSAGFVTSEAISGTPDGDSFTEVTFPMSEKSTASGNYEARVSGGCSIAELAMPGARGGLLVALPLLVFALVRAGSRMRRRS